MAFRGPYGRILIVSRRRSNPQVPPTKVEYCLTEIGKGPEARLRCSSRLGRILQSGTLRARKALVSTKAEFNVEVIFSAFSPESDELTPLGSGNIPISALSTV